MHVQLTPQTESIVNEMLATGEYDDPGDVIEQAVRLLEDEQKLRALRAALAVGQAQLDRGEGRRLTPALLAEMDQNVARKAREGRKPTADVCP